LAVTKEVVSNIGAAAILVEVFRCNIKSLAQNCASAAYQDRAASKGNKHPFVRIEGDRVSVINTLQFGLVLFRQSQGATICRINVEPAIMLLCDSRQLRKGINYSRRRSSRNADNATGNAPSLDVSCDLVL